MDEKLKAILLEMVDDLADLRANLAVIVENKTRPVKTFGDARDAKTIAKQEHGPSYDPLRQKIKAL